MNPLFDDDDDFIDWFDRLFEETEVEKKATFRLVLPDTIIFGLSWIDAKIAAEAALDLAGYSERSIEQSGYEFKYFIRQDGKYVLFATIEMEE